MKAKITILSWSIVALGAVVLTGCNSQPKGDLSPQTHNSPTLVEQQIANLYQSIFNELPQGGLRAASNEKVGNGETYITNFAKGGFMLYNVDSLGEVILLGISEGGSLSTQDTIHQPMLRNILNQAAILGEEVAPKIHKDLEESNHGDPSRSPLPWIREYFGFPRYTLDTENFESKKPMKPSTLEFGQYAPFFNYLPKNKETKHDLLGCANTALAAFFSFYKLPKAIVCNNKTTKMDWEELWDLNRRVYKPKESNDQGKKWRERLKESPILSDQIALMCMYIYYETGHIWSGSSGTAVENWRVKRFLKKHNFNPDVVDYDEKTLLAYLQKYKRPVLAYGEGDNTFDSWHYWVFDGYMENRCDLISVRQDYEGGPWVKDKVIKKNVISRFYHCNWGWNGDNNGYFRSHLLRPFYRYGIVSPTTELRTDLPDSEENYARHGKLFLTYPGDLSEYWTIK